MTDTDMLKWANTTAQRGNSGVRPIRSFKDPSITTGLFFLDLLDAIRPGIVDPSLVIGVAETGEYDDRRQNGALFYFLLNYISESLRIAKLAISIARKMNALIFLVPEDIVDVRPRLVCHFFKYFSRWVLQLISLALDSYFCWKSHEYRSIISSRSKYCSEYYFFCGN